jgi:hypothetical protein
VVDEAGRPSDEFEIRGVRKEGGADLDSRHDDDPEW